jgi:hypothetical protein
MSYSLRAANHGTAGRVTLPFRLASCALANLSCSYSRALLRVFSRCLSIGDDPRAAIRAQCVEQRCPALCARRQQATPSRLQHTMLVSPQFPRVDHLGATRAFLGAQSNSGVVHATARSDGLSAPVIGRRDQGGYCFRPSSTSPQKPMMPLPALPHDFFGIDHTLFLFCPCSCPHSPIVTRCKPSATLQCSNLRWAPCPGCF